MEITIKMNAETNSVTVTNDGAVAHIDRSALSKAGVDRLRVKLVRSWALCQGLVT